MSITTATVQFTQVEIPEAIEPLHLRYARFALNEFLRVTEIYRKQYSMVLDGSGKAALPLPDGLAVVALKKVEVDGKKIQLSSNKPLVTYSGSELTIDLALTGVLSVEVALTTSPLDGDIEADDLEQWVEVLSAGTLTRLYTMGSYPWANAQMAAYSRSVFNEGIERARVAAKRLKDTRLSVVAYGGI